MTPISLKGLQFLWNGAVDATLEMVYGVRRGMGVSESILVRFELPNAVDEMQFAYQFALMYQQRMSADVNVKMRHMEYRQLNAAYIDARKSGLKREFQLGLNETGVSRHKSLFVPKAPNRAM